MGNGKMSVWEIERDCQETDITLCQKNLALKSYTGKAEVICIKYTYPLPFLYKLIKQI